MQRPVEGNTEKCSVSWAWIEYCVGVTSTDFSVHDYQWFWAHPSRVLMLLHGCWMPTEESVHQTDVRQLVSSSVRRSPTGMRLWKADLARIMLESDAEALFSWTSPSMVILFDKFKYHRVPSELCVRQLQCMLPTCVVELRDVFFIIWVCCKISALYWGVRNEGTSWQGEWLAQYGFHSFLRGHVEWFEPGWWMVWTRFDRCRGAIVIFAVVLELCGSGGQRWGNWLLGITLWVLYQRNKHMSKTGDSKTWLRNWIDHPAPTKGVCVGKWSYLTHTLFFLYRDVSLHVIPLEWKDWLTSCIVTKWSVALQLSSSHERGSGRWLLLAWLCYCVVWDCEMTSVGVSLQEKGKGGPGTLSARFCTQI